MREIKFRAWHKDHKSMVFFDWAKVAKDQYQMQHLCALLTGDHTDGCVMQYTGLKDKNGVKIYEGDILYIAGLGNCLVGSEDGFFGFTIESKGGIENIGHSLEDIEHIIGNIHENPKLLEQQK